MRKFDGIYFVMLDDGVNEQLGCFERMLADERIEFDVGVLETDQRKAQLPFDGFQIRRKLAGGENAQPDLIQRQLQDAKVVTFSVDGSSGIERALSLEITFVHSFQFQIRLIESGEGQKFEQLHLFDVDGQVLESDDQMFENVRVQTFADQSTDGNVQSRKMSSVVLVSRRSDVEDDR